MGGLTRRLAALEERLAVPEAEARREAYRQFLRRLTREELEWLLEPDNEAQSRVPCPHVEMLQCACRSDERRGRGFEAHPGLREEYLRRRELLFGRAEEIVRREPEGRFARQEAPRAPPGRQTARKEPKERIRRTWRDQT
jgi:hypothetical protein